MALVKKQAAKKPKKETEADYQSLDAAVSELSKQTEALLGTPEKPLAVKKVATKKQPKAKTAQNSKSTAARSFDVITPEHATKKAATLKASPVKAKQVAASETAPAGESGEDDLPMVVGHEAGTLQPLSEAEDRAVGDAEIEQPKGTDTENSPKSSNEAKPAKKDIIDDKPAAHEELTFEEDEDAPESPSNAEEPVDNTAGDQEETSSSPVIEEVPVVKKSKQTATRAVEPEDTDSSPDSSKEAQANNTPKAESEEGAATNSDESGADETAVDTGEVYANNLVKNALPKGYMASVKQQKPTVFDTNEVHPELHDWSKLESKGSLKWFIVATLVLGAAAAAYVFISGTSLPF